MQDAASFLHQVQRQFPRSHPYCYSADWPANANRATSSPPAMSNQPSPAKDDTPRIKLGGASTSLLTQGRDSWTHTHGLHRACIANTIPLQNYKEYRVLPVSCFSHLTVIRPDLMIPSRWNYDSAHAISKHRNLIHGGSLAYLADRRQYNPTAPHKGTTVYGRGG